ncbi:MAG: spermidine synthase [Candidatus Scalindua sp.]
MKPTVRLATARTPDGGEMELYRHDRDFSIKINGLDLMNSRQHESELELARLGCTHLTGSKAPSILIGGLGLGYTLRQVLDMLSPHTKVVVSELMSAVVEWNRDFLGEINGQLLEDKRVEIKIGDLVTLISRSTNRFDAILLDIDNGPSAMADSGNQRLYGYEGIQACRNALREQGSLAVWATESSKEYERLLMSCGFHVRRYRVPAYKGCKGSKAQSRFVWVASGDESILPPGGGEPHLPLQNESRGRRIRPWRKH